MKKALLFLSLFFCIALNINAKSGYKIEVSAPQLAEQSIYLAGYYNGRIYAFDTLNLDKNGKGNFEDKKTLDEGMYMIYINAGRYYEFLLGQEQSLKAKIDTLDKKTGFDISGGAETEAFVDFGKYMTQKREEQDILRKELKATESDTIKGKKINDKIKDLDNEVVAHQAKTIKEHEGKILGLFIKSLQAPQFPKELIDGDINDKDFALARYHYAKEHFWDNIDITDKRSWRLNLMTKKIKDYTEKMLIQTPDSMIPDIINLIEKSKKDSTSFNLMTNYMINFSVNSKVMGIDKLFVEIADRYYFTGQAPWADSTIMATITSEVKKVRHNLLGMKAKNLALVKFDGTSFNTNDIKKKFTLLFFYEPTCGHCKESTPKMHKIYEKYKDKGFDAVAIYLMTDKKEWKNFLDEHKLHDWTNAWDPTRESYYWQFFDTSTTPGVYLLDENKKIIAKKIDAESLEKILNFELNGVPMTPNKEENKEK